ncbi:hypothetical protein So717_38230 [Roseobacter cerasinus]|uniref:Uncharacterized protein n=1 Tax=Roseobacter cerasinus TaxID=2602289 RepID=A0A640VXI4_9RHOB|nr:hypothetical protein [Roseobacter cerasinus]GFE52070.1 hypothetical protein So717_38230 [Roseobacter cerasinus]
MTETPNTPDGTDPETDTDTRFETLLNASNWDELVKDARAKREKVLAERSRQTAKAPVAPAPDPEPAPEQVEAPEPAPVEAVIAPAPMSAPTPVTPAISTTAVLRAVRPGPRTDTAAARPPSSSRSQGVRMSLSTAVLAVACCGALGFGLSLGFATMATVTPLPPQAEAPTPAAAEASVITRAALPDTPAPVAQTETTPPIGPPARPSYDVPANTPPRVHVYAPASVTTAALDQRKADLDRMGFETATVQRLNFTVSAPHVRYYDAADAVSARALAQDMDIEARDFSHSGNGSPGRVEIWLDGTAPQRTARTRQTNPVDELIRIGNEFIRSLQ